MGPATAGAFPMRMQRMLGFALAAAGIALGGCALQHPAAPVEHPHLATTRTLTVPTPKAAPQMRPKYPMTLDPRILIGLRPDQAELIVGRPKHVSQQPPATVWAYGDKNCGLRIFFYPELNTETPKALAVTVDTKNPTPAAKGACFAHIRAQAHG